MNCHMDKSKIDSKTLAKINELYPSDAATGYAENQLRRSLGNRNGKKK